MATKRNEERMMMCPLGRFFLDLEKAPEKKAEFFKHLDRSRIEFLKAIRALLDERIEDLEGRKSKKARKRASRIDVE